MLSKTSKWELGFVHNIAKFTISRFVISRFECTLQEKILKQFFFYTDFRQPVLNFTLQPITHLGNDVTDTFLSQIYAWNLYRKKLIPQFK